MYPLNWTTGWDNYSSTAYAINQDKVVVYDDRKAIIAKVGTSPSCKRINFPLN